MVWALDQLYSLLALLDQFHPQCDSLVANGIMLGMNVAHYLQDYTQISIVTFLNFFLLSGEGLK